MFEALSITFVAFLGVAGLFGDDDLVVFAQLAQSHGAAAALQLLCRLSRTVNGSAAEGCSLTVHTLTTTTLRQRERERINQQEKERTKKEKGQRRKKQTKTKKERKDKCQKDKQE